MRVDGSANPTMPKNPAQYVNEPGREETGPSSNMNFKNPQTSHEFNRVCDLLDRAMGALERIALQEE